MIQRIQTLFLILAVLSSAAIFFLPLAHFSASTFSFDLFITGVKTVEGTSPIDENMLLHMGILVVLILLSIIAISLYKNRPLQMKLCRFGMMLNIVFIVLIFMFSDVIKKKIMEASMTSFMDGVIVQFGPGSIMPLITLIFLLLANRFINKDERLIRAADRLR